MAVSVSVRMYRQGFGDCILLTIRQDGDEPRYALIDCGVMRNMSGGSGNTRRTVQDIADTTNGHLDLIVVTHEHYDHVIGFWQERQTFGDFTVGQVWLAWTEDPDSKLAAKLKQEHAAKMRALCRIGAALGAQALPPGLAAVAAFEGQKLGASEYSETTAKAMDQVRKGPEGRARYLRPGDHPREIPGVSGIRCHVLGPPENEAAVLAETEEDPTATYYRPGMALAGGASSTAFAAGAYEALGLAADLPETEKARWREWARLGQPFEQPLRIPVTYDRQKGTHEFGADEPPTEARSLLDGTYRAAGQEWRRIDDAWLHSAGNLALQLDSGRNNTSLVLALELVESKKVLLFVGDAELANWQSWDCRKVPADGCTAKDLLARTVLYKVGHHGSVNATASVCGLERMGDERLVAMIPVCPRYDTAQGWRTPIPYTHMLARLSEKTGGRIVLAAPKDEDLFPTAQDGVVVLAPKAFREDELRITEAYVEYTVSD